MRTVLQRVSRARVTVEGRVTGEIGAGLVILLGVGREDKSAAASSMAEKVANLRIFEDDQGKMNRSLLDVKGSALVVSQFTLYGDARGQRRPSFIAAAPPDQAVALYEQFNAALRGLGVTVATGIFLWSWSMKARSRSSSIPRKRSNHRPARTVADQKWTRALVLRELKSLADPAVRAKMAYFGVNVPKAHGISAPVLHALARRVGKDHALAKELWSSGIHEARILAALIGEPDKITSAEMDRWAVDLDSWDVVDASCRYLYVFSAPAWEKVEAWSSRPEEFVKRAAFSLAAYLSYIDKNSPDTRFERLLSLIERESCDDRNFVRKAVNWALRQIGKRNLHLNAAAIGVADRIRAQGSRSARWIAADALRELKSAAVQRRLRAKKI
jgi:D-tyrosyl-tRNA(Tyr) deacylase